MSKKNLLFRGVGIGYLSMLTGMAYSFLSIPLALGYLGKQEYGLWTLVLSVTSYLNISDLGVSNSLQRHLIDVKNNRPNKLFGAVFLTGAVAFAVISLGCLVIGGLLCCYAPVLLSVPDQQKTTFQWLLAGAVVVFSLSIGSRILSAPLYVFQRYDLYELGNIILYVIWFLALVVGLRSGLGVYSLLLSQGVGFGFMFFYNIITCSILGFYPSASEWSIPDMKTVREIAIFSRDSFLQQIGQQLIASLPVFIVTKFLGLEAVAVWTIGVRPFFIINQIIRRPFQYVFVTLSDAYSNNNLDDMINSWVKIARMSVIGAFVIFPACTFFNSDFLRLWTHGKISWGQNDTILCGVLFGLTSILSPYYGMVGVNKKIGILRWASLAEPLLAGLLGSIFCLHYGLLGLLIALLVAKICMGVIPTIVYLKEVFGGRMRDVYEKSLMPPLKALPVVCLVSWLPSQLLGKESGWAFLFLLGGSSVLLAMLFAILLKGIDLNMIRSLMARSKSIKSQSIS